MVKPSGKTIGLSAAAAALAGLLSQVMPYIDRAVQFHTDWVRLHTRLEHAESRIQWLEDRTDFDHGKPTAKEVMAIRETKN